MTSYNTPAEQILKELPQAPAAMRKFVLAHCAGYIIIDKKAGAATCTSCETELDLYSRPLYGEPTEEAYVGYFEYKHNAEGKCPCCGRDVTVKSAGIGRKSLAEKHRVLLPIMKDKTLYMTLTEVIIDFQKRSPELYKWISAVYKVNDNELTYYKHHPQLCYDSEYWEPRKNFKLPAMPQIYGYANYHWYDYMYPISKINACCDRFKYLNIAEMAKARNWDPKYFVGLVREAYKYPAFEILYKAGFETLAYQRTMGWTSKYVNMRGWSLAKIFRSNMETVRDLRTINACMKEVQEYMDLLKKYGYRATNSVTLKKASEIDRRIELEGSYIQKRIKSRIKMARAVEYIISSKIWTHDWVDYIKQLIELDMKLNSKNMYPKDFRAVHEALSARIKIRKDEKLRASMAQMVVEKAGETIKVDSLLFIPASTPEELENEGRQQHHCVAMYAERVARGDCLIYMIRKESEPEKPYLTMQLTPDGKIKQLRGFANSAPEEEAEAAAKKFAEEFRKNKKEKKAV